MSSDSVAGERDTPSFQSRIQGEVQLERGAPISVSGLGEAGCQLCKVY